MKSTALVAAMLLLLGGCASGITGMCRHKALYCASVFGERYPVELVLGKTGPDAYHVQARAEIDGVWQWLSFDADGTCRVRGQEYYWTVIEHLSFQKWAAVQALAHVRSEIEN